MNDKREQLVICGALRTPFCFGNRLSPYRSERLLAAVLTDLLAKYGLDAGLIDTIVAGSVQQDTKAPNVARISALLAGFPDSVNAHTVQSNCNSTFLSLLTCMGNILLGSSDCAIAGGVESMSNFGYRLHPKTNEYGSVLDIENALNQSGAAFLNDFDIVDCLEEGLKDSVNDMSMIEIAEIMANLFGVTRAEQDAYTRSMLERAVEATDRKKLQGYLTPVGDVTQDTYPLNRKRMLKRPDSFAKAPAVFAADSEFITAAQFMKKHGTFLHDLGFENSEISPTVTMYNSCIPGDGAGVCIVTTEEKARELRLTPLLRIISWGTAGVNPVVMGIGPNEAVHLALTQPKTERARNIELDDMHQIEIHEAFASQVLSVFKQSEVKYNRPWHRDKVNVYGGTLAYTHPLGSTNIRLITNILSRFEELPAARYALATCCAGGGQGAAFVFERYRKD